MYAVAGVRPHALEGWENRQCPNGSLPTTICHFFLLFSRLQLSSPPLPFLLSKPFLLAFRFIVFLLPHAFIIYINVTFLNKPAQSVFVAVFFMSEHWCALSSGRITPIPTCIGCLQFLYGVEASCLSSIHLESPLLLPHSVHVQAVMLVRHGGHSDIPKWMG